MIAKVSKKQRVKNEAKKQKTKELHTWFRELWDEREDEDGYCYCFETGKAMHRRIYRDTSTVYSHILPKASYPQYAMLKRNVVIILPEEHRDFPKVGSNQHALRVELMAMHDLGTLN